MNVEIVPFSNGIYQARSLAMRRAAEMARQLNATLFPSHIRHSVSLMYVLDSEVRRESDYR
jgi:hypothetical protein